MNKLKEFYDSIPNGRCKPCEYGKVVVGSGEYLFLGCYCSPYNGKRVSEIKDCPHKAESEDKSNE